MCPPFQKNSKTGLGSYQFCPIIFTNPSQFECLLFSAVKLNVFLFACLSVCFSNSSCTHWGKLNSHLCLNIKIKCNEQCIEQNPTTTSSSTRSLQRCIVSWFLIYTCPSIHHVSVGMGHLSPLLQDDTSAISFLSPRETSFPYTKSFCPWHSCSQPV